MLWIVGVYVRFFEDLTLRTFGLLRFFDVIVFFQQLEVLARFQRLVQGLGGVQVVATVEGTRNMEDAYG